MPAPTALRIRARVPDRPGTRADKRVLTDACDSADVGVDLWLRYPGQCVSGPHPRLFVIVATQAPRAVIVRRGPAAWAQLILWETDRDHFVEGAWLRGRIYAEKCDLSPDGQLFLYAAFQGSRAQSAVTDSYTALSRPPWLHALALWPMGTTYGGGGRFVGDRRVILRGAGAALLEHTVQRIEIVDGTAELHRSSAEVEGAQWSGRDHANRLIFARDGRIFARSGLRDVELADLTAGRPDPRPAPEWAKQAVR